MLHGADIAKISSKTIKKLVNNFSTILQGTSLLKLMVTNTKKFSLDMMLPGFHISFSSKEENQLNTMKRKRSDPLLILLKNMDPKLYKDLIVVSSLNKKEDKLNSLYTLDLLKPIQNS